jgi:hypothetical protein
MFGLIEGIEFLSVVADFDVERARRDIKANGDLMFQSVVISVFDNVGHDFLNGEVGSENHV